VILDLTSARFLGSGVATVVVAPDPGKPQALQEPAGAARLARRLVTGCGGPTADAALSRSTLHALLDVFSVLGRHDSPGHDDYPLTRTGSSAPVIVHDEHVYPVTRWAARIVTAQEPAMTFGHHDAGAAYRALVAARHRAQGRPLVLASDGWCAGCLRPAPLAELSRAARRAGAHLVIDDSLAAGVLGADPSPDRPFGAGGCGTRPWLGAAGPAVVVASAAKAFGVPVATVLGPARLIAAVKQHGPSRMHTAAPGAADLALLTCAMAAGDLPDRRIRLAALVARVRAACRRVGWRVVGRPFPLVAVAGPAAPAQLHRRLGELGVRTLLVRAPCRGRSHLVMCLRADLTEDDLGHLEWAVPMAARRAA
jgi:8-amino-7-oxononanoate synthase